VSAEPPRNQSKAMSNIFEPGFLTIWAKFSDIFGRKSMFLLALATFTIFSGLCAASVDIVEL
jgi:MFS family permease